MTPYVILSAYLVLLAFAASTARAADPPKAPVVAGLINATRNCETQLGQPRSKARYPWRRHSDGYWVAEQKRWKMKRGRCLKTLHAHDATIRRLQRGLAGTPMDGSAGPLEAAGRRYGVSPYFIAGVACTESTCGESPCSNNRFNAFGLASCVGYWGTGNHKTWVPAFRSWAEVYDFMGRYFTGRTSVTSGWWPWARTTFDIRGYAKCSACWAATTARHMRSRFGVGPEVRYS